MSFIIIQNWKDLYLLAQKQAIALLSIQLCHKTDRGVKKPKFVILQDIETDIIRFLIF